MSTSVVPVGSTLHGRDVIEGLIDEFRPRIGAIGGQIVRNTGQVSATTPLAVLVLTGGTERAILDTWSRRAGEPLLLFVHAGHNSLPAALEALARVHQQGGRGRIVALDRDPMESAQRALHDLGVWHAMRRCHVGLLGEPSDWLVASTPDEDELRRRWGPTIIHLPIEPTLAAFEHEPAVAEPVPVGISARNVREPTAADLERAARFEPVLRRVAMHHALDAVAVRCFDLLGAAHTSGCVALSALNDEGVIAGCEGDVASTIGLLWIDRLLGQTGWMANPAVIDSSAGTIELAHCTVPRSLVDSYDLRSHFESGLGVGIAGTLPPGPVTVLRLGGCGLDRLWCEDGEALPTTPRDGRCRTQLDVRVSAAAARELLAHPLGNHLIVARGHHAGRLRDWFVQMVAPVEA